MVKSAPKSVSKTFAKPSLCSAATSWPVTIVPGGRPNISPMLTRTDGATWHTTCLPDWSAVQTSSIDSFSLNAPVGQTIVHWPHETQGVSAIGLSNAVVTAESSPLHAKL